MIAYCLICLVDYSPSFLSIKVSLLTFLVRFNAMNKVREVGGGGEYTFRYE